MKEVKFIVIPHYEINNLIHSLAGKSINILNPFLSALGIRAEEAKDEMELQNGASDAYYGIGTESAYPISVDAVHNWVNGGEPSDFSIRDVLLYLHFRGLIPTGNYLIVFTW